MSTCAECVYCELQCPPVIRCRLTGVFKYLDTEKCESFELAVEDEEEPEKKS